MKLPTTAVQLLALVVAPNALARVVPAGTAPYQEREVTDRAPEVTAGEVYGKSAIHDRVTRHIRPDYSDPLVRRDGVLGPATDLGGVTDFKGGKPQPTRGAKGAIFLHASNEDIDRQNIDYLSQQPTDAGVIPNLKWSFSLSKTRLLKGGWVREQVVTDLPTSKTIAAAEQRLAPFAYRELHWHRVAEWGLLLNGSIRITGNDEEGKNYVSEVSEGSLWSFPNGVPHSLQAGPDGAQYLLVFDDGDFDASGTTFMVDDWIAHTPREVLAENFGWNTSAFDNVPATDPYIVTANDWPTLEEARAAVDQNPAGEVKEPYYYNMAADEPVSAPGGGGWTKIVDYKKFPASRTLASAYIHVEPGAIRELHWHRNTEWGYLVAGRARATAFAGGSAARTFELQPGDSWVMPTNYGHYIENIGDTPLEFIEIFRGDHFGDTVAFNDFSLTQWLALNPPEVVSRQLNVSIDLVKQLKKEKQVIVKGNK